MKNIKVLGSGCKNCETTANLIRIAAEQAGAKIELEKITDMAEIMGYGVMSTPRRSGGWQGGSCRRPAGSGSGPSMGR